MSGIANVIPGANFSGSILGKVTKVLSPAEKAAEIVSAYTTAIGNTTYVTQLQNMVKSLIDAGAWEGIDIYPMLGSTLAHKQVNLNPDDGFIKEQLLLGSNASNVDGGLSFTTSAEAGSSISPTFKQYAWADKAGIFIAADVQRDGAYTANSNLYVSSNNNAGNAPVRVLNNSVGKYRCVVGGTEVTATDVSGNSRAFIAASSTSDSKLGLFVDGEIDNYVNFNASSTAVVYLGNFLGSSPDDSNASGTFNGTCRFWVIGKIDASKHAAMVTIFKTFLDAVKPSA